MNRYCHIYNAVFLRNASFKWLDMLYHVVRYVVAIYMYFYRLWSLTDLILSIKCFVIDSKTESNCLLMAFLNLLEKVANNLTTGLWTPANLGRRLILNRNLKFHSLFQF